MFNRVKMKYLRFLAKMEKKKRKNYLDKLSDEQRYVFNIAKKIISFSDSDLESSPNTGIFYVRNGLKLLKFDDASVHFVNGKFSYLFSYDCYLMDELKEIFYRHKQIRINHLIKEISKETTDNLKTIFSDLNIKQ